MRVRLLSLYFSEARLYSVHCTVQCSLLNLILIFICYWAPSFHVTKLCSLYLFDLTSGVSVALDTILHGPPLTSHRRHSVSVCQTPSAPSAPPTKKISLASDCDELQSVVSSLSSSRGSLSGRSELSSSGDHDQDHDQDPAYHLNTPEMHANLQSELIHSVS